MADCRISALWSCLLDDVVLNNTNGLSYADAHRGLQHFEPGGSVRKYASLALLKSISSKFQDEINEELATSAAFAKFHKANNACSTWSLRTAELGPYDEVILGELKSTLYDFFNPFGYSLLSMGSFLPFVDFGPGSAPGAASPDFITKIGESDLTATSDLVVDYYYQWVSDSPSRLDCEIARLWRYGPPSVIKGAKISAVPKKADEARLVNPQPSLNMFFQKGIAGVLRRRLLEFFGIDLSTQPGINQELARRGSKYGNYATIDLSSASDYIARSFCQWVLPKAAFHWLDIFRTKYAETGSGMVELHMMATMGNDYCFPLQTILFASIVFAVYRSLGLPLMKKSTATGYDHDVSTGEVQSVRKITTMPNFGVFGDDIIVLEEAYEPTLRLLRCLGFVPNKDKSFGKLSGTFRESCGADWYNGFNVRGVYCKSLRTIQDRFALINSLVDWSSRTGIRLPLTIEYLRGCVPDVLVPPWENPDSGIRAPLCAVKKRHKVFRCTKRHRDMELHGSFLYKRYVPKPHTRSLGDIPDGTSHIGETQTEGCYWNSSAVFLAAIKGHCRGGMISIRQWETSYRKSVAVAPCWDYCRPGDPRYEGWPNWLEMATAYFRD